MGTDTIRKVNLSLHFNIQLILYLFHFKVCSIGILETFAFDSFRDDEYNIDI